MRWARYLARLKDNRDEYKMFVRKVKEKKTLGRPSRKWKNFKIYFTERNRKLL
jgi:hypothetical protein